MQFNGLMPVSGPIGRLALAMIGRRDSVIRVASCCEAAGDDGCSTLSWHVAAVRFGGASASASLVRCSSAKFSNTLGHVAIPASAFKELRNDRQVVHQDSGTCKSCKSCEHARKGPPFRVLGYPGAWIRAAEIPALHTYA